VNEATAVKAAPDEKRQVAHALLEELLERMEFRVKVESRDGEDGGIAVALFPEGELPGLAAGRRSPVLEALQFLVNKVVNPPTTQRRWVTLGVGGYPVPRVAPPPSPVPSKVATDSAPATRVPAPASNPSRPTHVPAAKPAAVLDESKAQVSPDPLLTQLGKSLAERSSKLGRFYAVLGLVPDDRARLQQAGQGIEGVKVESEGEGRNRRLVFRPERPAPVVKTLPVDEDEDE
jgi:predicted RNA-binding protein Jag